MNIGIIIGIIVALLIVGASIAFVMYGDKKPVISAEVVNSGTKINAAGDTDSSSSTMPAGKGFLALGEVLKSGLASAVYSKNTLYMIVLQDNGELQVRKGGINLWRTNIYAPQTLKGCYAKLEAIGIVVRDASDRVIWQMLSKGYVTQLQLDIQRAVIDDSGTFTLRDSKDNIQYTLNLNRIPAIADKSKIDNKTFIGSMCNDAVIALNAAGQLVHATCHPSNKDKAVYYKDIALLTDDVGVTSAEFNKGSFTYKLQGKPDLIIDLSKVYLTSIYMITMDHSGSWSAWTDFTSYMNNQSSQYGDVTRLCSDRLALDTSISPDFTIAQAPFTLRANTNPFWMQITENGDLRIILQHLDQKIYKELKKMPGMSGFKSDKQRIIICFGPVSDDSLNIASLDVVTIGLVDSRPADQLDSRIKYGYVFDPTKQIQIKPPATMTEKTIIDQIATNTGFSRIAVIHQIDVPIMAHMLAVSEFGGLAFKTADQQLVTLIQ